MKQGSGGRRARGVGPGCWWSYWAGWVYVVAQCHFFFSFPNFCGLNCAIFILLFSKGCNGKATACSLQAETQANCCKNMALLHD